MKRLLFLLWMVLFLPLFIYAEDTSNCADFKYGQVCVSLKNNLDWTYSLSKKFYAKKNKSVYLLTCRLLLPNWIEKQLWSCDKSFSYENTETWKVDVTMYLETEWKRVNFDYNFISFTKKEADSINNLIKYWPTVITKLKKKYTKLKNSDSWNSLSDSFFWWLDDLVNGKESQFNSYQSIVDGLKLFMADTIKLIKKE